MNLIYTDRSVCIMAENLPKEARQSQIMEAAMKVITRKGFSNARIDDIVNEAGLSKGAIYHHYEGKKDLFLALIDHWETQTFPDFYSRNGKERSASDTLRDFSEEIIKEQIENEIISGSFLESIELTGVDYSDGKILLISVLLKIG